MCPAPPHHPGALPMQPPHAPPGEQPTAAELFATFRAGYGALVRLLEGHRPYLLKIASEDVDANLLARNGVSDVVQDTLLNVLKNLTEVSDGFFNVQEGEGLTAWLRRVLQNVISNTRRDEGRQRRDGRREQPLPADVGPREEEPSPSGLARESERDAVLQEQMNALQEADRMLLRLSYWHRWTDVALAELLHGPPG